MAYFRCEYGNSGGGGTGSYEIVKLLSYTAENTYSWKTVTLNDALSNYSFFIISTVSNYDVVLNSYDNTKGQTLVSEFLTDTEREITDPYTWKFKKVSDTQLKVYGNTTYITIYVYAVKIT